MGVTVREKPAGSSTWWVFIAHQGRRKSRKIGTGEKDRVLAEKVAAKINAKMVLKQYEMDDDEKVEAPTFRSYADTWKDAVIPVECKASTVSDYKNILTKHILPVFGNKPVTEIDRAAVKRFLRKKLADGKAVSTVTHIKNAPGRVSTSPWTKAPSRTIRPTGSARSS